MDLGLYASSNSPDQIRNLDPTLGFSLTIQEHQDLLIKTTGASITGILKSLENTGGYANAVRKYQGIIETLHEAMEVAARMTFREATVEELQVHRSAVMEDLHKIIEAAKGPIQGWKNQVTSIRGGMNSSSSKAVADQLTNALDHYASALELAKNGDDSQLQSVIGQLTSARTAINNEIAAKTSALEVAQEGVLNEDNERVVDQALVNSLTQDIAKLNQLKTLANSVISRAGEDVDDILSPSNSMYFKTPVAYSMGGDFTLATWGNSGSITITDKNGYGLRIHESGNVDVIGDPKGKWKAEGKTTFVFDGDLKVTLDPGKTPELVAILGNQILKIDNLSSPPSPNDDPPPFDSGAREFDEATLDGQIAEFRSSDKAWVHYSGQNTRVLGDDNHREVLNSGDNVERRVDAVDIQVPEELWDFFAELHLDVPDLDGDGKLNEAEFHQLSIILDEVVRLYQSQHADALGRVAEANRALEALTTFMLKLQSELDDKEGARKELSAAQKDELNHIEARLNKAIQAMKVEPLTSQQMGEKVLQNVLNTQLQGSTSPTPVPHSSQDVGEPPSILSESGDGRLSRASRLLGSSLYTQNLIESLSQINQSPSAPSNSVDQILGWLGENSDSITLPQLEAGMQNLLSLAKQLGVPAAVLGNLENFVNFLTRQKEGGLRFSLGAELGEKLEGLGFSEETLTQLAGLLAKVDLLRSSNGGQIPAVLSEKGLLDLLSMLENVSDAQGREVLSNLTDLVAALENLSKDELVGVIEQWPAGLQSDSLKSVWNQFASSVALLPVPLDSESVNAPPDLNPITQAVNPPVTTSSTPTAPASTAPPPSVSAPISTAPTASIPSPLAWLGQTYEPGAFRNAAALLSTIATLATPASSQGQDKDAREMAAQLLALWSGVSQPVTSPTTGASPFNTSPTIPPVSGAAPITTPILSGSSPQPSVQQPAPPSGSTAAIHELDLDALAFIGWLGLTETDDKEEKKNDVSQLLKVIVGNIMTAPELLKRLEANLKQAIEFYKIQMHSAERLFEETQEVVQRFFEVIKQDDLGKEVIKSDVLSDEQQAEFEQRMLDFRKDLGIEWGHSETAGNPEQESNRVRRMMQSGMMV